MCRFDWLKRGKKERGGWQQQVGEKSGSNYYCCRHSREKPVMMMWRVAEEHGEIKTLSILTNNRSFGGMCRFTGRALCRLCNPHFPFSFCIALLVLIALRNRLISYSNTIVAVAFVKRRVNRLRLNSDSIIRKSCAVDFHFYKLELAKHYVHNWLTATTRLPI